MVSASVAQAIIIGIGAVVGGLLTVSVALHRHIAGLHGEHDAEKIDDLQSYNWGVVSSEIQSLYNDVEEYLDENPYTDDMEIEFEAHLTEVIREGVSMDDLEDLIENARNLDQPSNMYNKHEEAYQDCLWNVLGGAAVLFTLDASIIVGLVLEAGPFEGLYLILNGLLGLTAAITLYEAWNHFKKARRKKKEFDEIWQEYRYEY